MISSEFPRVYPLVNPAPILVVSGIYRRYLTRSVVQILYWDIGAGILYYACNSSTQRENVLSMYLVFGIYVKK